MPPITSAFPTLLWVTQSLATYSLPLGDQPSVSWKIHHSPPGRSLLLLAVFACCHPPPCPRLFVAWPHHCLTGNGSQILPAFCSRSAPPCPIALTCSWVLTSLGVRAHMEKATDSAPSKAFFCHPEPPAQPSPSLESRELHGKETSIEVEGAFPLDINQPCF